MLRNSIIVLSTAMLLSTTATGAFAHGRGGGGKGAHFAMSAPPPVTGTQTASPIAMGGPVWDRRPTCIRKCKP